MGKKKELLAKVEIFEGFNRFEIAQIAEACQKISYYDADESIIVQETLGDCFFILLSGTARVCQGDDPKSLFTIEAGAIFGEIAFLSGTVRTKHIIANENCFILELSHHMLRTLDAEVRERIKDKLIEKLVGRIISIEGGFNKELAGGEEQSDD